MSNSRGPVVLAEVQSSSELGWSDLQIGYPGWGTWCIDSSGGPRVVVDPCVTPLLDDPCATLPEVSADVVLLTHGHHEHIRDIHWLPYDESTPIVAPPQVAAYLIEQRGMKGGRFCVIRPNEELKLPGLRVVARSFPHLPKNDVSGKLGILRRDNPFGAMSILLRYGLRVAKAWTVIKDQPEGGPYLAYDIYFDDGPRVFVTCEAFTELLRPRLAASWGSGEQVVDLALVGVESGQEEHAANLLDSLGPRRALGAAVHAPSSASTGSQRSMETPLSAGAVYRRGGSGQESGLVSRFDRPAESSSPSRDRVLKRTSRLLRASKPRRSVFGEFEE